MGRCHLKELLAINEGWRGWIVQHLVPPSGVFYHAVEMAGSGFILLVLHYVVLEEFFSFNSARHSRKNPPSSPFPTPSSSIFTPTTKLIIIAQVITPFPHTVHFHSYLVLRQTFLRTIKKTIHRPQLAHNHTY